jgi:hypothetical protein
MNERDFPHIVELMVPPGGFHDEGSGFEDFHRERGIPLRPGQGRQEAAQSYVRFCFPNVAAADAFHERFGGNCLTYAPRIRLQRPKPKSKRMYAPRIVGNEVMTPAELEALHKSLLEAEGVAELSDEVRQIVEEEWPELLHKLPPRR